MEKKRKGGYGVVYQDVTRNSLIPPAAKGLYAYLASIAGNTDECYPGVDLIRHDMKMSKDAFYKYIGILIAAGVVEKKQVKTEGCRFGKNIYKLTHQVYISGKPYPEFTDTEKQGTELPDTALKDTNNNSTNNNSINNNSNINYQQIADMYNDTCVSFPRLTKLSETRKKAIKARLNTYTVDDFKKLFALTEESDFLKGKNNRNWCANFDWLVKDANMAKVLDGNYSDKPPRKQETGQTEYDMHYLDATMEEIIKNGGCDFGEDAPFK